MNQDGTAKLFYNNDNEAINHMLKNGSNWERRPLSDVLDLIDRSLTAQKNETIRSLYGGGELQLISPFVPIWSSKSQSERAQIIRDYYAYQLPIRQPTTDFNIPATAERKPGKKSIRETTSTIRSSRNRKKGL
ncbi:unnamed protein product [Didymodactylos carnosus]|uniref:Uncharacterized protein n=1 Tax=Didymodactylos carnosus TaxID=1234261 RepID=A0A814KYU2_9BILA|nr:unnamed protein product [Didymodactylos carnosus]CAF1058683.1 unnamed protein product [Didymodactylos carnosus]CAF3559258.1 unnamed protein product [Didymodactylos carnosus]CAF3826915.1 unnamed protein product [Didymodactylos carnosus]